MIFVHMIMLFKLIFCSIRDSMFYVLEGTYKALRAIDLLFNYNFFQSFLCDGKNLSF